MSLCPKKTHYKSKVLSQFEIVKAVLQSVDSSISCTIDGWTSLANKSFYGITSHYVDQNFEHRSFVLDFIWSNGCHTGVYTAQFFFNVLLDFSIERKIRGITMDNVSSNTVFMQELQILMMENDIPFDAENQHFRCFGHILNLGNFTKFFSYVFTYLPAYYSFRCARRFKIIESLKFDGPMRQ